MQAGMPQGSALSPTLYNLYINDMHQTPRCELSSLCGRHMSICDRLQGGLCSEKDPAWAGSSVNTGILKSIKTRLERSTSLVEIDRLILFLR
jgi:hypothetical protein